MFLKDMVCVSCFWLGPKGCQEQREPMWHDDKGLDVRTHWCAQGRWWDSEAYDYVDRTFNDDEVEEDS